MEAKPAIEASARPHHNKTFELNNLHQRFLGETYDRASGKKPREKSAIDTVMGGGTFAQAEMALSRSRFFRKRMEAAVRSSADYGLDMIYRAVLDRPIDDEGRAHYGDMLRRGVAVGKIIDEIFASHENRQRFVRMLYEEIFERDVDEVGLRVYTEALDKQSLAKVVNTLKKSEEFRILKGRKKNKVTLDGKPLVSRRNLLIAVPGLAVGAVAANELAKGPEGRVETAHGIFLPVYEYHEKGIQEKDVPDNLDVLFAECTGINLDEVGVDSLLGGKAYISHNTHKKAFTDFLSMDVLSKLSRQRTKVMLGDVDYNNTTLEESSSEYGESFENQRFVGVMGLMATGGLGLISMPDNGNSRRKFLRMSALAAAGVSTWANMTVALRDMQSARIREGKEYGAVDRIIGRMNGIASDFNPQRTNDFFRNLMAAIKLQSVAEEMEKRLGRKPVIGFNFHYGHSGIEDFLQAGPEVCRKILSCYSPDFIRKVVECNYGPQNFSSMLLLDLPKDVSPEYLRIFMQDPLQMEHGREKITDKKLLDLVEKKVA